MLLNRIGKDLSIPQTWLLKLARRASHCYKTYTIPKRRGGTRIIDHPSKELKGIQRWLLTNVIEQLPVHEAVYSYRKGFSPKQNAACHANSRFLLRLDLIDFFPSITSSDIRNYIESSKLSSIGEWSPSNVEFFVRIVCKDNRLTIGAPTSPALSNAICYELDSRVKSIADRSGVAYTRYADDLFFSSHTPDVLGSFPEQVQQVLNSLDCPKNLRINSDKTRHSSKRGQRRVTGLILGSDGKISIGRHLKRYIRGQIHRLDQLNEQSKRQLSGWLAYAQDIEPEIINSLILKYGVDVVEKARSGK